MERRDAIIVGGGPAGSATALYLARRDPALARRVLILDKAVHPRLKVCAGGLIPHTLDCLDELGLGLGVPHVAVDRARVEVPSTTVEVAGTRFAAIIRRAEFDAALLAEARRRGAEVREGEAVRTIRRRGDAVQVTTDRDVYEAPIVVGADGAGSLVRRSLLPSEDGPKAGIARAVMADVPVRDGCTWDGHDSGRYDFDFRAVPDGLPGYVWAFPCLIDGVPHVNAGVYTRRPRGGADPVRLLHDLQTSLGGPPVRHRAAPIRCWARSRFAAPHVLLVGDAAGVESLMGEGISFAFEYGRWAAHAIAHATARGDFAFADAERRFRRSWVGRKLRRLDQAATMFYGPGARLWLGLAARWRGAQLVGLCWYNGIDGWDRRSGWQALWTALGRAQVARAALGVQ